MGAGARVDGTFLEVLNDWAERSATGCLRVGAVSVHLLEGAICCVDVPEPRPALVDRLMSGGTLSPEALAEADHNPPEAASIGAMLVAYGYVAQPAVDAFFTEQILDACARLLHQPQEGCHLIECRRPEGLTPGLSLPAVLAQVAARTQAWRRLAQLVPAHTAVPTLSAVGLTAGPVTVSAEAWSILCLADGRRSVADLAASCGFTAFEATYVVAKLVHSNYLERLGPTPAA